MKYIYYIDGEKFTNDNANEIPFREISSPNEQTPTFEDLETGHKFWCLKGWYWHRLTGPARIWPDGSYSFWLNDHAYKNVNDWLKEHPNQDNTFQVEMLLKYS